MIYDESEYEMRTEMDLNNVCSELIYYRYANW